MPQGCGAQALPRDPRPDCWKCVSTDRRKTSSMVVTEAPKLAIPSSFCCFSSLVNRLSNLETRPRVKSCVSVTFEAGGFSGQVWGSKGTSSFQSHCKKTLRSGSVSPFSIPTGPPAVSTWACGAFRIFVHMKAQNKTKGPGECSSDCGVALPRETSQGKRYDSLH